MGKRETVFIETTIPSYLVAKESADPTIETFRTLTHMWWDEQKYQFDTVTSRLVLEECTLGDPTYAQLRREIMAPIPILTDLPEAQSFAKILQRALNIPDRAKADALHIAIAAAHGIQFLLTWNCKHLANPRLSGKIGELCTKAGFVAPIICTPNLMLGNPDD